jgi:hypothetical protein
MGLSRIGGFGRRRLAAGGAAGTSDPSGFAGRTGRPGKTRRKSAESVWNPAAGVVE